MYWTRGQRTNLQEHKLSISCGVTTGIQVKKLLVFIIYIIKSNILTKDQLRKRLEMDNSICIQYPESKKGNLLVSLILKKIISNLSFKNLLIFTVNNFSKALAREINEPFIYLLTFILGTTKETRYLSF